MKSTVSLQCVYGLLALFYLPVAAVQAASTCEPVVGRLVSVQGQIEVQRAAGVSWQSAVLEDVLCQGDSIRSGPRSRAAVALINEAVLRIDQDTTIRLVDIVAEEEEKSVLGLILGAFQSFSRKPRRLEIDTPYLNGAIEGTEFVFRVEQDRAVLNVLEGRVLAANDHGRVGVAAGEAAIAQAGRAPVLRTVVKPRDAVQWALYYPPILALSDAPFDTTGDSAADFRALQQIPTQQRDARFYLYRAALLLSLGRVDQAGPDIDRAIALDPRSGSAAALRAVIAVTGNDKQQALDYAEQATALSPDAVAPKIALSYAQQANFQIDAARDTLLRAVERQPNDALAWARLAELHLMLGERQSAVAAARRASELAPRLERGQITLGFAALAEFRIEQARAAFERAIELNSADPLSRFGLGLAKISAGELAAGRNDIEIAVGLDSNNALLRAYLGKAYFEERREPLDDEQFAIARQLDPLDPTGYLYAGISKQTRNRPVEALRDLQTSIALNDNRAVYRGRLLLDQDRATRGVSIAQAYNDLGFNALGIDQASQSLALDPANASAHRFLSDSYLSSRRREIARVSELLQAQLLQDNNLSPIQPSVAETNLNAVTLGGPARPGFNEFTALFQQNRWLFNAAAFAGGNDTLGGEAVLSALHDRGSFSIGAYTYESDGWRPNNRLDQTIFNVFAQLALTPRLNVQFEYRDRDSREGDLAFNFDPDDVLLDKTVDRDQQTARVGVRYSPAPSSDVLFSYIHSERDESLAQSEALDPFTTLFSSGTADSRGYQAETQYIYRRERFNIVTGAAYSAVDLTTDNAISVVDVDIGPVFEVSAANDEVIEHPRGYFYTHINYPARISWTIGASYDQYSDDFVEETSFNPKFGVRWNLSDDFGVRAAAFKTLKPALVNNRTIEPTQIAGFNQFFDDINATQSWRYGLGFDWRLTRNLFIGGEASWRDIEEPVIAVDDQGNASSVYEDRDEQYHRLYLNWTPRDDLAVTAELVYDLYESESGIATEFDNLPLKVETFSVPLGLGYFAPSGFFIGINGTYVDQKVERSEFSTRGQGSDRFFVVDAALGYRLPKRRGILSLGVKNLFDENFNYQDDSYREFRDEPATGPYFPERIILGRVGFNF